MQKTRKHYNTYPYEVGIRDSKVYKSPQNHLGRFIIKIGKGYVLDIGCGPGNLLPALGRCAERTVGLDISQRTLHQATYAVVNLPVNLGQGDALKLPFYDQSFDFIVATGSFHHTPDARAAFFEAYRVLRPGGLGFFTLYQIGSYYFYLYHTLGYLARACELFWLTRYLVNRCLILPIFVLYFLVGRLLVHHRLVIPSYTQILNYFADQMLTPVASFHDISEISQWTETAGVDIVSVSYSHAGALVSVEIRRPNTTES